jgi:hypothetical protein
VKCALRWAIFSGLAGCKRWHGPCNAETVKNVTFIAGPKNGAFVNTRLTTMHHSAEGRMGLAEAIVACFFVVALLGFALVIVR